MIEVNDAVVAHVNRLAALAGETAMGYFRNPLEVELKEDESPVTQADKAVEVCVRTYLQKHFPDDGIVGEEFGQLDQSNKISDSVWSIDPIDGTRSFLSGHPLFGFLLARLHKGVPEVGVIGMPALGETLVGRRRVGTTLNGRQVFSSNQTSLDSAIVFINEGEKLIAECPEVLSNILKVGHTRRFSYDCYPHALLAMGQVDVVVDYDLQPYDYLPIVAVVEAAGGVVTDWQGNPLTLSSGGTAIVSAATPELHAQILSELEI